MPRKFAVEFLFETHLGMSPNVVRPAQREERKSVGASRTFTAVDTEKAIFEKIDYIASLLEKDLESEGWAGKVVILTYKLDTFKGKLPFSMAKISLLNLPRKSIPVKQHSASSYPRRRI